MELWRVMPWQMWVLISGVLTGLAQAVGKKQLSRLTALQMGAVRDLAGLAIAILIFFTFGTGDPPWQIVFAVGNGMMVTVGVALYFVAVRTSFSGASVFGYLISQVMIVISSAVLFAEWVYFDPTTLTGMGNLAVLALTVTAMGLYLKGLKLGKKWLGILLLSAIINVAGNLVAKYFVTSEMNVWDYFAGEQLGLAIGGLGVLYLRGQNLRMPRQDLKLGVIQGVLAILGPMIYLNVLTLYPLSLAALVRRIAAILVTSILGLTYYREREGMGIRAYLGLILAGVAFILVMIVNR